MGRHNAPRKRDKTTPKVTPLELGILAIRRTVAAQTWDELTEQARTEDHNQRRGNTE